MFIENLKLLIINVIDTFQKKKTHKLFFVIVDI